MMKNNRINIEEIFSHIEYSFPEHLEKSRNFVRQPSISATGYGIKDMAKLVANEIELIGGTAEIVPTGGNPVVFGEIDVGASRTILVYGMYDVQPVEGENWIVQPFAGEIVEMEPFGPCLVNRGIMNSKGPLIGFFCAMQSLKSVCGCFPVNLKFVIEGEEELGSVSLSKFVEDHHDRLRADAAFFPFYSQDRNGKLIMYLGIKGMVFLDLEVRGGNWGAPTTRNVHAMNAGWFHSPAWPLVDSLSTMLSRDQKLILIDDIYDDVAPPSAEDLELLHGLSNSFDMNVPLKDNEVEHFKYKLTGEDLLRKFLFEPSLNIDGLYSGCPGEGMKTVLPHEAHAKIDIRLVPKMEPNRVADQVRKHLSKRGFDCIEVKQNSASYPASKGSLSDLANNTLIKAYQCTGYQPEIWPLMAGAAPFYLFTQVLGMPLAIGGLGHGGRQHSPNEYATVEGMRLFEKSAAAFVALIGNE